MDTQLKLFKEYKQRIKAIAGEKTAREIISKSFYLVITGADDLANTYFTTPFRRNYNLSTYIQLVVQFASKFYQVNIISIWYFRSRPRKLCTEHHTMARHMMQNIRKSDIYPCKSKRFPFLQGYTLSLTIYDWFAIVTSINITVVIIYFLGFIQRRCTENNSDKHSTYRIHTISED